MPWSCVTACRTPTNGGGINSTLSLYQNGKFIKKLPVTSRYSWLYGKYPFTNDPKAGKPRDFYDEVRLKDMVFAKGDVIRLQKAEADAPYCIVDLVDLEEVARAAGLPGKFAFRGRLWRGRHGARPTIPGH